MREVLGHRVGAGQPGLQRDVLGAGVAAEGDEEEPGVEVAEAVAAVDVGVAPAQDAHAPVGVGVGDRHVRRPAGSAETCTGSCSAVAPIGAPEILCRPVTSSCSRSETRSQLSMRMAIRRATR